MRVFLLVGLGGFLGSVCRYALSLLPLTGKTGFPFATLLINVIGSLLIGILAGIAQREIAWHADWFAFLRTGFCGGFTTFSTFALETAELMSGGQSVWGFAYVAASILLGLGAIYAGQALVS